MKRFIVFVPVDNNEEAVITAKEVLQSRICNDPDVFVFNDQHAVGFVSGRLRDELTAGGMQLYDLSWEFIEDAWTCWHDDNTFIIVATVTTAMKYVRAVLATVGLDPEVEPLALGEFWILDIESKTQERFTP